VLVGGAVDLGLQARELTDGRAIRGVLATLLTTPSGLVWLSRAALLGLLAALWVPSRARAGDRWRTIVRAGLAAAVVISGGLVSHSAAVVEGRALALGAEAVHLLATALWVGGLLGFALVLWPVSATNATAPTTSTIGSSSTWRRGRPPWGVMPTAGSFRSMPSPDSVSLASRWPPAALWAASWRTRRLTRRLVADADPVHPVHCHGGS
jgi:hypothetical protein